MDESPCGLILIVSIKWNWKSLLVTPGTKTIAFTQGLKEGDFFISLFKKIPRDFEDLLSQAEKYLNIDEAHKLKRESAQKKMIERTRRSEEKGQRRHPLGCFS